MALYVYITDRCKEDAQSLGFEATMAKAKAQLLEAQRVVGFHDFPPPYIRKKSKGRRLLASRHAVGEDTVITFLRVVSRESSDYRDFLDDRDRYRDLKLKPLINSIDLNAFVEKARSEVQVQELREPTNEELAFLFRAHSFQDAYTGDVIVSETHEWVEAVKSQEISPRLSDFHRAVLEIAQSDDDEPGLRSLAMGSRQIVYRNFAERRRLLLIGVTPRSEPIPAKLQERYGALADSANPELDEIGRVSRRAYPQLVLADEDAWFEIQADSEANLALSFEETEVLFSADANSQSSVDDVRGFPLFINGRAGSGKSTILQYLFSDYLASYLSMSDRAFEPPAYFTYNSELLERARKVVGSLLHHGAHGMVVGGARPDLNRDQKVLDNSFHQLHRFLYDLLPAGLKQTRFRDDAEHKVTYARFKALWHEKFGKTASLRDQKEFGPDLSWHVIRTYIKGMSLEPGEPLEPEDYASLPQKRRTVTLETYERVYSRVYESWYRLLGEEGYWDDQDLAHALLEEGIQPRFPAIFCDEAQDFTPLELEVLYRLSIFSDRSLHGYLSQRVPFVFAGDPFQTLNPTGFSWDAIKANYTTKLLDNSNPDDGSSRQINYRELEYNYRSTWPIVKFSNTLQAMRSRLLDVTLAPQSAWSNGEAAQNPLWYDRADESVAEQLRRQTELTIIVPVDEGEEAAFVKSDPLLSKVVEKDEHDTPMNVLSPMRAKGLEFRRVALYGFGAAAPASLMTLIDNPEEMTPEEALPFEYFINRLYVAASRPKRRLFVIDSADSLTRFWDFARSDAKLQEFTQRLKNARAWQGKLGILQQGLPEAWQGEREDQGEVADKLRNEGFNNRDPYLLRQAALQFEAAGSALKAKECRAAAFEMEGATEKAARTYLELGQTERATRVIWQANDLNLMREAMESHDLGNGLEVRLARMVDGPGPSRAEGLALLTAIAEAAERDADMQTRVLTELAWGERIADVALAMVAHLNEMERGEAGGVAAALVRVLGRLQSVDANIPLAVWGYLQFMNGNDEDALGLWNSAGTSFGSYDFSKQHRQLLALEQPYPASLRTLAELNEFTILLKTYRANPGVKLEQPDLERVLEASITTGSYDDVASVLPYITRTLSLVWSFAQLAGLPAPNPLTPDLLDHLLLRVVEEAELARIEGLVSRNELIAKKESNQAAHRTRKATTDYLRANRKTWLPRLLGFIARSETLAQQPRNKLKSLFGSLKGILAEANSAQASELDVAELGAIAERIGSYGDALTFYEQLAAREDATNASRRAAIERWIAIRERQARESEEQGRAKNAGEHRKQARQRRREIDLASDVRLAPYPVLKALGSMAALGRDQVEAPVEAAARGDVSAGQEVRHRAPIASSSGDTRISPTTPGAEANQTTKSPVDHPHPMANEGGTRHGSHPKRPQPTEPGTPEADLARLVGRQTGTGDIVGKLMEPTITDKIGSGKRPASAQPPAPASEHAEEAIRPRTKVEVSIGRISVTYFPISGTVRLDDDTGENITLKEGCDPTATVAIDSTAAGTYSYGTWGVEFHRHAKGVTLTWSDSGIQFTFPSVGAD